MLLHACNTQLCHDQETGRVRKVWPKRQTTSVPVIYCCETNHPKLSGLKQPSLIAYDLGFGNWAGFSWDGFSLLCEVLTGLGLGKRKGQLAGWLGPGWDQITSSRVWQLAEAVCQVPQFASLWPLPWVSSGFLMWQLSFKATRVEAAGSLRKSYNVTFY